MDEDDPLAQYRRPGAKRPEQPAKPERPSEHPGGLKPYLAFEAKEKLLSLDIRRVRGTTHSPTYAYLLNVAYDYEFYETFVLYYSFMQVKVRGKNLKDVITAIKLRQAEYIQDFHSGEHERPQPGAAVITSITVEWKDPTMSDQGGEKSVSNRKE